MSAPDWQTITLGQHRRVVAAKDAEIERLNHQVKRLIGTAEDNLKVHLKNVERLEKKDTLITELADHLEDYRGKWVPAFNDKDVIQRARDATKQ